MTSVVVTTGSVVCADKSAKKRLSGLRIFTENFSRHFTSASQIMCPVSPQPINSALSLIVVAVAVGQVLGSGQPSRAQHVGNGQVSRTQQVGSGQASSAQHVGSEQASRELQVGSGREAS